MESESVMAWIEKQIEAFHKVKAEAMGELEDCMDELESVCDEEGSKLLPLPADFDERVEVQVDQIRMNQEDEVEDILDENGKPLWH